MRRRPDDWGCRGCPGRGCGAMPTDLERMRRTQPWGLATRAGLVNLPLPSHGRFLLDLNPALRGFFLPASRRPRGPTTSLVGLSVNDREVDPIDPLRSIRGNNTSSAPLVR